MMRKGISPLIAAVLLIAFTMAVAGILATWATQFVRSESQQAAKEQRCVGALGLGSSSFNNGNVSVTVSNLNSNMNLTGLRAFLTYTNTEKNKQYILNESLKPLEKKTIIFSTNYDTKPKSVEVSSKECSEYPIKRVFH